MNAVVVPLRPHEPATLTGLHVENGVAVMELGGRLDPECLTVCRRGLDQVLARRPRIVVLDLAAVTGGRNVAGVLSLMRSHAARHGAQMWLACAPAPLQAALLRADSLRQYRLLPTRAALAATLDDPPTKDR